MDGIDLNGQGDISIGGTGKIDLDADDDTSIRASADDIISFEAAGTDQLHISDGALYAETTNDINLGDGTDATPKYFKNAYINNITGSSISASKMIFTTGTISGSIISGTAAYFSNLEVTGSATAGNPQGTGSFGRVQADVVVIHNHEIIGGSGLTVNGLSTTLGTPGQNDQPTVIHGNLTASNAWFSGSGGNVSASTLTLTSDFTTLGNISGSYISASKGFWTAGEYSGSSLHVENGISGSFISASKGLYTAGVISGSSLHTQNGISGSYISASKGLWTAGNITGSGNLDIGSGKFIVNSGGNIKTEPSLGITHNVGSDDIFFNIRGAADSNLFYVEAADDRIGIGTGTGALLHKLQVKGNVSASGVVYGQTGVSGSYISASTSIYSAGHITASGTISASSIYSSGDVSGSYISASKGLYSHKNIFAGNNITASSNISASGDVIATNISASGDIIGTNYRSFYVAAAGMTPSVTNGAAAATVERPGNAGTGNTYHSLDYLAFDGGTNEFANFQMTMPDEWDRGVLKAKFYWLMPDDGTAPQTCTWGINATTFANNTDISTAADSFTEITDTNLGDFEKLNITTATGDVTVAGTHASGSLVFFRVNRNAASDSVNVDTFLLGVGVQYRERAVAEISW